MIYRYSIPTVKRGTITISRDLKEERTGAIPSSMKKLLQRRNIRLSKIFFLFLPFYFTHFLQDHSTLSFIRYTHDNLNKRRPKHQSFVSLEYPHYSIFLLKVTKDTSSLKKPIFFLWRHTKSFNYSMLISYKIKIVSNLINLKFLIYYY